MRLLSHHAVRSAPCHLHLWLCGEHHWTVTTPQTHFPFPLLHPLRRDTVALQGLQIPHMFWASRAKQIFWGSLERDRLFVRAQEPSDASLEADDESCILLSISAAGSLPPAPRLRAKFGSSVSYGTGEPNVKLKTREKEHEWFILLSTNPWWRNVTTQSSGQFSNVV